jgi:hypothetical protein
VGFLLGCPWQGARWLRRTLQGAGSGRQVRQAAGLAGWRWLAGLRACLHACLLACSHACLLACARHHALEVSLAQPVALPPQQVHNHGPPSIGVWQGDVHPLGQSALYLAGAIHTQGQRAERRAGQAGWTVSCSGTQAGRRGICWGGACSKHDAGSATAASRASSAAPAQFTASSNSQGRFVAPSTTTRSLPLATPSNCRWQGRDVQGVREAMHCTALQ